MEYPLIRSIVPPIVKLWVRKVTGLENVPKEGPFIIAANHSSYFDHFAVMSTLFPFLDKKIHFIAKKEHFDSLHQKLWHSYFEPIPIDRNAGDKALDTAISFLKEGKIIAIYPEGTRTLTGDLQRGKTGVARLVLSAKVPVVPVGLIGTFDILPKGKYIPRLRRASMHIGKPMAFDRYFGKKVTKELLHAITDEVMECIASLCNKKYPHERIGGGRAE